MKLKQYIVTALSLAGIALSAAPVSAWFFNKHHHGINRFSTVIVCRPYNAFTPVCSGNLVCDGCCPFSCPQMPTGASCSPMLGNPMLGLSHGHSGINSPYAMHMMQQTPSFINGPYATPYPTQMMDSVPSMALPAPQFQAPLPTYPQQSRLPMQRSFQPTGYSQAHYQGYYPMVPRPMSASPYQVPYQQAPAYWYGY
jgi:hypothetical protein